MRLFALGHASDDLLTLAAIAFTCRPLTLSASNLSPILEDFACLQIPPVPRHVRPAPVLGARQFRSATARDRAVVEEGLVLIVAGMLIVMLTGSRCWWCSWRFDWRSTSLR